MSLSMETRQNLLNAIALRPLNWQLCQAVNYAVWCCTEVEVEIKTKNGRGTVVICLQGKEMDDMEGALQLLNYICTNARQITKLKVSVEVSNTTTADLVFQTVANGKRVQLEEIRVRRRYVGQQFLALVHLIKQQSGSLKVVGKLGLGEAIRAFDDTIHLKRFSMMNFDLIEDGEMESEALAEKTRFAMRRLAGLGATFDHLSYTTYSGFEITKNPAIHMLKMCKVKSIRLTQQNGVAISDPAVPRPLLPELKRIELVGCVEVRAKKLEVLFPALERFHIHKQDLVTGGAYAGRSPSNSLSIYDQHLEGNSLHFPIAAAC